MDKLAGLFGKGKPETPLPAEQAGLPPGRAGTSGVSSTPSRAGGSEEQIHGGTAAEPPAKKRGFWSKVFGRQATRTDDDDASREADR